MFVALTHTRGHIHVNKRAVAGFIGLKKILNAYRGAARYENRSRGRILNCTCVGVYMLNTGWNFYQDGGGLCHIVKREK